jgi:hypothetical protein
MCGAIPPLPQYVFMVWCLVKHRDNFYLYWVEDNVSAPKRRHSGCMFISVEFRFITHKHE